MELYLVRHAIAEDREDFAKKNQDDSLRPLTVKGRKRMQKVAMQKVAMKKASMQKVVALELGTLLKLCENTFFK